MLGQRSIIPVAFVHSEQIVCLHLAAQRHFYSQRVAQEPAPFNGPFVAAAGTDSCAAIPNHPPSKWAVVNLQPYLCFSVQTRPSREVCELWLCERSACHPGTRCPMLQNFWATWPMSDLAVDLRFCCHRVTQLPLVLRVAPW